MPDLGWALIPLTGVFIKRKVREIWHKETQRRRLWRGRDGSCVQSQVVPRPWGHHHKHGTDSPSEPLKGNNPLRDWFWISDLQNCERIDACCFKLQVCDNLLEQPQETAPSPCNPLAHTATACQSLPFPLAIIPASNHSDEGVRKCAGPIIFVMGTALPGCSWRRCGAGLSLTAPDTRYCPKFPWISFSFSYTKKHTARAWNYFNLSICKKCKFRRHVKSRSGS